jgi:ABC-type tungstate transport system permease subunit
MAEVKFADAKTWHEWLTTKPGLDVITSYKINDEEVFFPPRLEVIHSSCLSARVRNRGLPH